MHTAKHTGEITGATEEAGSVDVARSQAVDGQLVPSQHTDPCLCLCVCARARERERESRRGRQGDGGHILQVLLSLPTAAEAQHSKMPTVDDG